MGSEINHQEREHSKYSASGSERWLNCPFSVDHEAKSPPSLDSFWSKEGTLAHEVLEAILNGRPIPKHFDITDTMLFEIQKVVDKVKLLRRVFGGVLLIEKKVFASFIDPEMFGTCDIILAANDGVLHIIDFKYGAGHIVKAEKNTQLIQYALSVAESYNWEFTHVKMWVMQPRVGKNWFKSWIIPINELKTIWLPKWQEGVARTKKKNLKPNPGSWCHWCRGKNTCPAKTQIKLEKVSKYFKSIPIERGNKNGFKKESAGKKGQKENRYKKASEGFDDKNFAWGGN